MEFTYFDFGAGTYIPILFCILFWMVGYQFLDKTKIEHRRLVVSFAIIFTLIYVFWRAIYTLGSFEKLGAQCLWIWMCFFVELLAILDSFVFYTNMSHFAPRSKEADLYEKHYRSIDPNLLPTVDVFITTYNEGLDILERSIIGSLHLDWPKDKLKVYVLDDGRRQWLKDYAESKGAHYISRQDNQHFKAGNINHALTVTKGQFILVLDADFIPFRQFIYRTVGFMDDPKVAIVQTPQCFFNPDFIQANLKIQRDAADDLRIFFDHMMESRDGWDGSFWCGSCSLIRRDMIESNGGICTQTLTEDAFTSLVLLRKGYVTRYLGEKLTHGLSPENIERHVIQRKRWCRGSIQSIFVPEGPLGKNLKIIHRILFFPIYWIAQPLFRAAMMIAPILFFWLDIPPMVIESYSDVLFYQVPLILFSYMTSFWLLNGSFVPILSDASSALNSIQLFPTAMKSLIMPFGEKFRVTPKGKPKKAESGGRFYLLLCIALFTLTLVGLLLNMDPLADRTNVAHFFPVATTLCFYNLIILTVMILLCIEQPKNREQERFPSYEKSYVLINGQKVFGTILDISLTGSAFRFNQKVDLDPTNQTIFLSIPHNAILDQIPCRIIRHSNGKVFLHFENINTAMKDELIRHVLTGRYDNAPERNKIGEILKNLFERVFLYEKKPYKKY